MSVNSSNSQAFVANATRSRRSTVARIATEIVDLVERIDGPVPLNKLDDEVAGFKALFGGPGWSYLVQHNGGESVIWNSMTRAGFTALRQVLSKREVALQIVNVIPYVIENVRLLDPDWQPAVLLPIRAANIDGPNWAFRVPPAIAPGFISSLSDDARYRALTPQHVRSTADHFCV